METQPESTGPAAALAYAWGQYRVWAQTSRKLKEKLSFWRITLLILTLLGAALGIASSQLAGGDSDDRISQILAFLSALAVGLATFFGREVLRPEAEARWVTARSTAEGCKSESFKFATGAPPYDGAEAWKRLLDKTEALEAAMEGVPGSVITDQQRQERCPPMAMAPGEYLQRRVRDQIRYYDKQAGKNQATVQWSRVATLIFGVAGVVLSALGGIFELDQVTAWVAVTANLTAAATSFIFAGRYQYLAVSYRLTADRLRSLEAGWYSQNSGRAEDFYDFVQRCEAMLSIENQRWLVEWTQQKTDKQAPPERSNGNEQEKEDPRQP